MWEVLSPVNMPREKFAAPKGVRCERLLPGSVGGGAGRTRHVGGTCWSLWSLHPAWCSISPRLRAGWGRTIGPDAAAKPPLLDQPGFAQRFQSAVFGDRLEGPGGRLDGHELLQLGNPDALGFQIWAEEPWGHCRHVHADAALFLGQTPAVNLRSADGLSPCNAALS